MEASSNQKLRAAGGKHTNHLIDKWKIRSKIRKLWWPLAKVKDENQLLSKGEKSLNKKTFYKVSNF